MGSFSWNKADTLTNIENIALSNEFKFLIPIEFGGGFIQDHYEEYGYLGRKENGDSKHDMYELLAFWNCPESVTYKGEFPLMKEIDDDTDWNRSFGIDIGCYDKDIAKLKYPLKLVSVEYEGTYEDLETFSYGDPDQGFYERYRDEED